MLTIPPLSLYIHIPWCVQKCPYCDFNSHRLTTTLPETDYLTHLHHDLLHDLRLITPDRPIHTIFIGGGTPSLLSGNGIKHLLDKVKQCWPVNPHAEITLEANPGTLDAASLTDYQAAGITRLSIGVQSFHDHHLQKLGRIHSADMAHHTIQQAKKLSGLRINLDLMHGLPQQTVEQALDDLNIAISLRPDHLSWYELTLEPNTPFGRLPPPLPDDELLWQIDQSGKRLLQQAGYQHYETSAYAKAGHQCQHNLNYWRFGDYLGIGCGAHSKLTFADGRIMRMNKIRHPSHYLRGHYLAERQEIPMAERPFEFFMNTFRLMEPIAKSTFTALTGVALSDIAPIMTLACQQGYLEQTHHDWRVSTKGQLFLNDLLNLFLI